MGELSFSIPNAVRLGNIAEYIAPDLYEAAQARVKEGIKQSGRIVITPAQWRELCELEAKNREKLPEPFSREVLLRDFCLEIADTDYLVSYRQSEFASVNLKDGRKLEPKVDCLIGWRDHIELYKDGRWRKKGEKGGFKQHIGGIGLLYEKERVPEVAYYWIGLASKTAEEAIVDILSDYFVVQYAYYVLPNLVAGIEHVCND